jgi:tripartite-type tricarboxylate transporter receptor subunit TctC
MFHTVKAGLTLAAALAALLSAALLGAAQAQGSFPNRPITMVVPVPAGGTADILCRIGADQIKTEFGQNVVVENRAGGAGGLVGTESVFRAPPDGYTILCAPQLIYSIGNALFPRLAFDVRQFEPVSILASYPTLMLVRPELPVKDVAELIAYAKANPGKLNYGSQGIGQIGHLAIEQLKHMAGVDIVHVPFRGSAPAITALLGGQIDVLPDLLPATKPHIDAGKIKLIGVAGREPLKAYPDVPTLDRVLPNFEADTWMGVSAPPGTPKDIAGKLSDAVRVAFQKPEIKGKIEALNVDPRGTTPEEMADLVRKSADRWTPVIKAAKISIE